MAAEATRLGLTCTDAIIILAETWLIPRMSRADCRVLIWSAAGWPLRQPVRVSVSVVAVMISWADGNAEFGHAGPARRVRAEFGAGCHLGVWSRARVAHQSQHEPTAWPGCLSAGAR
jgi:hypothetical protein